MTQAIALTGRWEGLRAVPRNHPAPEHRKRLETALERLGGLYEGMAARAALLQTGMDRLNSLRAGLIDQLDDVTPDADFEDGGDDEPSLGAMWDRGRWSSDDREREDEHDEEDLSWGGEDATTDQRLIETSAPTILAGMNIGREGDGDVDREPSLAKLDRDGGSQVGAGWVGQGPSDDREADAIDDFEPEGE